MPGILDSLNPRQREAVCYEDGGLLVLAGAGTGKTRVLTSRIAWLVGERGLPPHAILAVTFTNKAAKEMRGRIFSVLHARYNEIFLGTFHGLCRQMLRQHTAAAGWDSNFKIMNPQQQKSFIRRLLSEHNIDLDDYPPADCCRYINSAKEQGLRAAAASDLRGGWREIYERYESAVRRENKMDLPELLLSAVELLRNDNGLRRHYAARFRHLLIDEFQDTSPLQYEWLKLLDSGDNCFFAVGDDDQSIYAFRGADPGNMENFCRELRADKIIRLEENYRSTDNILGAANALIARNKGRFGKNLFSAAAVAGNAIVVSPAHSDVSEAENIAEGIEKNLAEGIAAADIAVFYRTNAQYRLLEKPLRQRGIPYRIYGGQRFYERSEIMDALAYLRLAVSDDVDSLSRIIKVPPRKIGDKTIAALSAKGDIFAAIRESDAANVVAFCALLNNLRMMREQGVPLSELAQAAVADSGLLRYYESRPDKDERPANLRELVSAARQFEDDEDNSEEEDMLSAFLDSTALESDDIQGSSVGGLVSLMTVHKAKGLEFAAVHIAGLEEGVFPSAQSLDAGESEVEEERRLMYVALTRARRQLFLHYANERMLYGSRQSNPRSRFLEELPEEAMHYLSPPTPRFDSRSSAKAMRQHFGNALLSAKIHRPPSANENRRRPPPKKALPRAGNYRPGDSVRHAKYGDGIVVRLLGDGEELKLEAAFKQVGIKTFAVKLARLEKI